MNAAGPDPFDCSVLYLMIGAGAVAVAVLGLLLRLVGVRSR